MLQIGAIFFVLEFKNQPIFSPLDGAKCCLSCEVGQHSQSKVTLARFGWTKGEKIAQLKAYWTKIVSFNIL